ncbi:MAG: hypothetical protein EPN93_21205 [Spirochaetes bacterium]|nr:MAG: hypothetical protein EPN93_21205 [Spirochaetota bacterium]
MRLRRLTIPILTAGLLIGAAALPAFAEVSGQGNVPRIGFGLGGGYGWHDLQNASSNGAGKPTGSEQFTGGFVFEGMISEHMGLQGSLWYFHEEMKFPSMEGTKVRDYSTGFTIPMLAIFPFHAWRFTFGFLAGIEFFLMTSNRYSISGGGKTESFDALKFINYQQLAIAAGIDIRIAVFRFVDFFVSGTGEYFMTTFSNDPSGGADRLYGYVIRTGVMFRTYHIF